MINIRAIPSIYANIKKNQIIRNSSMKCKNGHLLFTYGILKSGERNHNILENPTNGLAKYVGQGQTARKYPMIVDTVFDIPYLLFSPGDGHHVTGEVYDIDCNMLECLDILCNHPSFYERMKDDILLYQIPKPTSCWVYFIKNFSRHEVPFEKSINTYTAYTSDKTKRTK